MEWPHVAQSCRSWNELLWNDRVTDKELHKWSPSATDKESGQIILSVPQTEYLSPERNR